MASPAASCPRSNRSGVRAFAYPVGPSVAYELVNWFNQVDLTYRTELRELNDLNFARFDAKVGERLAELRTTLRTELLSQLRADMDAWFRKIEQRFTGIEQRFERIDQRLDGLDQRLDKLAVEVRDAKVSGVKWTVAFWMPTILALIAVLLRQ